ncbi:MAG: helix-hairpin-helix domain-containing protein, partial [Henriciella sp.]
MESLDIDDVIAHLLIAEGFVMVEDIAETPIEELMGIQGFDEDIAGELSRRAIDFVNREAERISGELDRLKVADDLRGFNMLTQAAILSLAEAGILTLDDLADLDTEELMEHLSSHGLNSTEDAGEVIMAARAHWFEDEIEEPAADAAEGDAATDA